MGARALQSGAVAQSVKRVGLDGHERRASAGAVDPQHQSRSRVLAADVSAPARRQHRLRRVCHPGLRERPTRRPRAIDPTKAPSALASAWASYANQQEPNKLPVLLSLAASRPAIAATSAISSTLLKPQPVDPTVGTRDFDVQDPGSNLPGIDKAGLKGILRLGGALEVPDADLSAADKADARHVRELGPALSRRVRGGAREVHQPAR